MKKRFYLLPLVWLLLLTGCKDDAILLSQDAEPVQVQQEAASGSISEAALSDEDLYAYVCGEVESPGVYSLPAGSRIYELVEAAGGMTETAAPAAVNLAEVLSDGQMVNIPSLEALASPDPGEDGLSDAESGKININTATKEVLMSLSGIGETKADSILSYRDQNGPFAKAEDLMQVDGIGQGTYSKIKDKITV